MEYLNKLLRGRNDYSPSAKKVLLQYGNVSITNATIYRKPINELINGAFKMISLALLQKRPYDKLFHLSIVVRLQNGTSIVIEKNEVINIALFHGNNGESLSVNISKPITLNTCMENTKNSMKGKFFPYSGYDNNCQDFISALLKANNWETPQNISFVKQDTKYLFSNLPILRKFANTITDIAGRANVVLEGGNIKKTDNGMTNVEIENILKSRCNNFNGIYSKDILPNTLNPGWYVVNMQDHDEGNGTHWMALKYEEPISIYFDSFGIIPPTDILERMTDELSYNARQIQDLNSSCCGWYVIACILTIESLSEKEKKKVDNALNCFIHMFSKNTSLNDRILNDMLRKMDIKITFV